MSGIMALRVCASGCHRMAQYANQRRKFWRCKNMTGFGRGLLAALAALGLTTSAAIAADAITVQMFKATQDGSGESLGSVTISPAPDNGGTQFKLALRGLPPGPHGFHVHQNDSCMPINTTGVGIPAGAAGGHWDPGNTGKHAGPMGEGHKGDLPVLEVANNGMADQTLVAPHITNISDLA